MKVRILLADDQPEVRSALRLLLEQASTWVVVGEASDAEELFKSIRKDCPDVVFLDWELPNFYGAEHVAGIREICSEVKVVALSSQFESRNGALECNVDVFVSKGDPPEKVLDKLGSLFGLPYKK